jgi:hypothetical protein
MFTLRLAFFFMLFTLLTGPSLFLPGQVKAYHCCPCSDPTKMGCYPRGTAHCPSCRAGDSDLFQTQAPTLIPASSFIAAYDPLDFTLYTTNLFEGVVSLVRWENRTIGALTLRFLRGEEFRIKSWCPGSEEQSV